MALVSPVHRKDDKSFFFQQFQGILSGDMVWDVRNDEFYQLLPERQSLKTSETSYEPNYFDCY